MRINNTTELQPKDTRKKVIYLEAALWPSVSVTVPWLIILNGRCSIAMFTTMRAALESTRINIFGVCVSESVQDRENEIHVKDGGDGLLSPFRSVCWSIWTCIFHSNTSCRQLEQEVCVCVGGGELWCPDRKEDGRWSHLSKKQSYEPVFFHFAVEREREWVRAQGLKREKSATVVKNNSVCRLSVYMCLWYVFNQSQSRLLLF